MAAPDTTPPDDFDTLERLRADVNDLAQTMGEQLGELNRRLDGETGGEQTVVRIVNGERLLITPADCVIIRLPAAAFDLLDGDEPLAHIVARVAADVLGTRRVLVLEDTTQITVAPIPPDAPPAT